MTNLICSVSAGNCSGGNLLRQLQLPGAALRGVEVDLLRFAVEVARRLRRAQVGVAVEQCLGEVVARRQRGEIGDREGKGGLVEHGDCAGGKGR